MSDSSTELRQKMAATRDQISRDLAELKDHASAPARAVKQRLDIGQLVRENPWSALGVALVLGAVVGGTGAERKAATAGAAAAKRVGRASKDAATGVVAKLHSADEGTSSDEAEQPQSAPKPGLGDRLFDSLGATVAVGIDRVLDEIRAASRDWGHRISASDRSRAAAATPAVAAVVAVREEAVPGSVDTSEADTIPVPNEMLPTELDARADAVEALGGGTHELPLAPGAGDLGARWA